MIKFVIKLQNDILSTTTVNDNGPSLSLHLPAVDETIYRTYNLGH